MTIPSPVPAAETIEGVEGTLLRHDAFPSAHVAPRPVDVWLPPGYDAAQRYPVLYLHDGQNLFLPETSFGGTDWGVDETLAHLAAHHEIRSALVVAVWNTADRLAEYMPEAPSHEHGGAFFVQRFAERYGAEPRADAYLRFLTEEVKPFVDATYPTCAGPEDTFVMGSSMGGLVSLYALCCHPDVFGAAACLSPSWPISARIMAPYLRDHVPDAATHRVYFDYGAEAHIGRYESFQRLVDVTFARAGYRAGRHRLTRRFPGAEHSEAAWRARLDVPLKFLLRPR